MALVAAQGSPSAVLRGQTPNVTRLTGNAVLDGWDGEDGESAVPSTAGYSKIPAGELPCGLLRG